ncbi:MAG: DUF2007 domain-containing protein [Carboxylicivirga sp.]|jgi:formate dehydrogenase assembly factor FdhD|nr:DUF2007 domain-containing protein [Carboxylicivirga sp.]
MENWITVVTFTQPHEAHFAKGLLESEGIETMIRDEMTAQVNNFYSNAIGGVKLDVKEAEMDKARSVLLTGGYITQETHEKTSAIEWVSEQQHSDKSICPFCQSDNIYRKKEVNGLVVVLYFILGAFFPIFKRNYVCYDCEKEWKFKK